MSDDANETQSQRPALPTLEQRQVLALEQIANHLAGIRATATGIDAKLGDVARMISFMSK